VYFIQAPLNTPVTEDKFALLTEKRRIPVPLLPGMDKKSSRSLANRSFIIGTDQMLHSGTILNAFKMFARDKIVFKVIRNGAVS